MECNASKGNISISVDVDVVEKTAMEVEREKSTADDSLAISENSSSVAPVIIEELDESAISSMGMDINEFVEAEVLQIKEVTDVIPNCAFSLSCNYNKDIVDAEDQDTSLTADEKDRLIKHAQFLNGELTFSEYSSRMDQDIDLETIESDASRRTIGFDHVADVQKIMEPKPHKANNGRQKRKRRVLPPVLQGLMGEANLRYVKGENELAAQICMEIIRQVPSDPEPFRSLATIYGDQPEKSLQFDLIAAYLSPKNADQWIRLAKKSKKSGDKKQAITCYSKAIQASPKDISLYKKRTRLQKQIGDKKAYLRGYTKLIHQLQAEDGKSIIKYAKKLAKRYMKKGNNKQALEAVETIFTKCTPDLITLHEVNIMTELLIALKQFKRCLDILVKYTNIQIRYKKKEEGEKGTTANDPKSEKEEVRSNAKGKATLAPSRSQNSDEIESCDVPDNVLVELKAKFLVTLIELDYISIVEKLLPKFYMRENPEIDGHFFLDVAEALMGKKEFQRAMLLLDPLVKSSNFSLAKVWLRYAECWVGCNNLDKAIESYEAVRRLSPQYLGARLVLAKLYKKSEHYDKAIQVLYQDPESDTLDPDVLYQRTLLLFKVGRYEEYFSSGMLLFSRHCVNIRRKVELNALARATGVRQRLDSLQLLRLSCGERLEDENAPTFIANAKPSEKYEFLLFLQMCKLACKLNKYGFLQRLCFTALTSKKFKKRNSYIIFLCLISCIHNKDSFYGYNIVREFVRVCQRSNSWNLLNIIIQRAEDLRHNRFIMRLLGRDVFSYLHIMHANNCLVSGTYKYALNGYMSLFKVAPSALLALLIGVTQLQMACQKMSAKKNQLVIQALAFFKKYMQLRGKEGQQETYYNMARAFHQIGLIPSAIHFYKLVLKEDPGDLVKQHANLLDLRKEAAFNLHLVYLQSENHLLATMCLENYITI
ncbi:general transcription factor 3C polypeptide 3-like isoform X1 [Temnothorax nylanderi]|uniref:general transcription factor 3C polypeptide 3-like isoform X1 n=2 Tax=Temnothorax nylanderi TaxID=102681 RepID=UPI003A8502CD